ncbi:MAG: hypothetical protein AAB853_03750 [Patescibacteria group bacterium]
MKNGGYIIDLGPAYVQRDVETNYTRGAAIKLAAQLDMDPERDMKIYPRHGKIHLINTIQHSHDRIAAVTHLNWPTADIWNGRESITSPLQRKPSSCATDALPPKQEMSPVEAGFEIGGGD